VLSGNVLQTNLVSDLPGVAAVQDPNLVNPWGISESGGSPFWISDNNAGVTTLYNTQGTPVPIVKGQTQNFATIPTPGDPTGATGTPTGTVFNIDLAGGGFKITNGTTSAPAVFLFATEDGTLVGWNPGVNPIGSNPAKAGTFATIALDNSANNFTEPDPTKQTGAVYKGLTIASSATPGTPIFMSDANTTTVLYAANFRAGTVEAFDTNFKPVTLPQGAFTDPDLPQGYAPFDVQDLKVNGTDKIFVTYALQNDAKHDDVAGPGHGFVDVYNLDGTAGLAGGQVRLLSRGQLNSPWGLAIAPSSFGTLAGDLLVGNFGDGRVNVYDPNTGDFQGGLKDPDGEPIQIDGLWALKVGNGGAGGDANTVYFTAGLDGETHGLFGSLTPVAPGTPEGPAEQQAVQAAVDVFQLNLATVRKDLAGGVSRAQLQQDLQNLRTSLRDLVRAEIQFASDATADAHLGDSTGDAQGETSPGGADAPNLRARDAAFFAHRPAGRLSLEEVMTLGKG
jgi:uncharacterized protein (TIGR03118 family)